jgi:hypothetical protein
MLIGRYVALDQSISVDDLRYKIDEQLLKSCMTPIAKDDILLLDELMGEVMISVMGEGFNRDDRRKLGVKK